ncbi:MAG: hypothetical protein JXA89_28770 [Anaerolineae bacterium]|nr:hypothetical protein [Anaerolineae bacterium]
MSKMDCHTAVETLLAYLDDSDSHIRQGAVSDAISHITHCAECEKKVGHLVRAWTAGKEDLLTCQDCEDLLLEYIQAEESGKVDGPRWRAMVYHLETCPHCSAAHAELGEFVALAWGEQGKESTHYPIPDLSFLPPAKDMSRLRWQINEWGRVVIELSSELLRSLQPPDCQPAYAAAGLKASDSQQTLIALEEMIDELQVTINAHKTERDPVHCTVNVQVTVAGRGGWPNQADTEVVLKRNDQILETQLTDAFGKVVFERIVTDDLAQLVFEITPCT